MHLHGMGLKYCDAASNKFNGALRLHRHCRAVPRSRCLFQGASLLSRLLTTIGLTTAAVQSDRSLGVRLLFSHAYISFFLDVVFQIARMLLAQVNQSGRRVPRQEARPALVIGVVKKAIGRMVCRGLCMSWIAVTD